MEIKRWAHKLVAVFMALAMLAGIIPVPIATAAGINDLKPFDTCANYGATGAGQTETLFQALFPGRFAVVAGGALNGRAGPNNEPVWLVLHNTTDTALPLGFDVSSGFFCEGPTYDSVVGHANKTGEYVGYLDLSPISEADFAPTQSAQTILSDAAPAQLAQFVAVNGIMLNRNLDECYTEPTGEGVTVTKTWNVQPGRTLYAFGWSINGSTRPAWVSVPGTTSGMVSLTVTDGIVVVCSTPLAFTPEVFDGFTELSINGISQLDGQHLLTQDPSIVNAVVASAGGDSILAQINWVKAHNQDLLNQQRGQAPAPVQQAQAPSGTGGASPTATPQPAPAPASGGPVRYTNSGSLNFSRGEAVFGAYIKVDGASNAVGMCYYSSAPNSGSVSGGVIGRMPFEQEIREQKLVSCG
ncbi:MAG: hypothetical protein HY376_00950 [Candidatus Blackburnbacteria bacterium]|nr:hypothetical protein [Candidatus Blackburnbacteria bacterium]